MQDEPEEEKGGSSAENEELLPNGEEMIEKINGSILPGKVHEGGEEQFVVKMRVEKCKEIIGDEDSLDDQNLSSALKRLAPTGSKQETEEEEEEEKSNNGQCGGFESTSSRDDRLQRATSAVSSGNNTLKRNWRKSSKKK